jgi:2-C-methyl-D-erythritol 4-phosphate cytidylyltransferase
MLLLAAGRGSRFGGPIPKAYLPLLGKPLVLHSAERLARAVDLRAGNQLIVVVHRDDRSSHLLPIQAALQALGDVRFAEGGDSRQESMQNGLAIADADADLILVHDAARALFPINAAQECVAAAAASGAALLALPVPDTLKRVRDEHVDRDRRPHQPLAGADAAGDPARPAAARVRACHGTGFAGTDDVSLVEHLGERRGRRHGLRHQPQGHQARRPAAGDRTACAGLA